MYSDEKKIIPGWVVPVLILALAVIVLAAAALNGSGGKLSEDGATAIRAAVQRCALQCYAVEGVYPPNIQYLEENYGLQVNTDDYYVTYNAFASNLPPTVLVTAKD